MNILKDKRGEGYIDTVIIVFVVVLMLALATKVLPVFIMKAKLDTFADEVVRCAEIEGHIGSETRNRINEFSLVLTLETDIGFFSFSSFSITLTSRATGRSGL